MKTLVYIHQFIEQTNGHSIVDTRLIEQLSDQKNISFISLQYDNKNKEIINSIDINEIDKNDSIIILSHFNTFRLARHFKKSKIVYINHDLPYYAYLISLNPVNFLKAIYSWSYIKYFWRYSDFNFFVSKYELEKSRCSLQKSASIRIGTKPIDNILQFKSLQPKAVFTGNYKWSLKAKSLQHVFKTSYTGSLELIAINVDEKFKEITSSFNIPINYFNALPKSTGIMLGVITDNFLSGFKLKALELIGMGCCVVSFADISNEFDDVEYSDLFIRKVKSLNELDSVYSELQKDKSVAEKFSFFYNDVCAKFNWSETADKIISVIKSF